MFKGSFINQIICNYLDKRRGKPLKVEDHHSQVHPNIPTSQPKIRIKGNSRKLNNGKLRDTTLVHRSNVDHMQNDGYNIKHRYDLLDYILY